MIGSEGAERTALLIRHVSGGQSPRSQPDVPLPAAQAHTECIWPWHLDPAVARSHPHLQRVVWEIRAGVVAVQRQWACVVVALDRVHGGSQVAASAVLEEGAPTEELEACAPARASGRQRQPRRAGAAPRESDGVKLEDVARPIQTTEGDNPRQGQGGPGSGLQDKPV